VGFEEEIDSLLSFLQDTNAELKVEKEYELEELNKHTTFR